MLLASPVAMYTFANFTLLCRVHTYEASSSTQRWGHRCRLTLRHVWLTICFAGGDALLERLQYLDPASQMFMKVCTSDMLGSIKQFIRECVLQSGGTVPSELQFSPAHRPVPRAKVEQRDGGLYLFSLQLRLSLPSCATRREGQARGGGGRAGCAAVALGRTASREAHHVIPTYYYTVTIDLFPCLSEPLYCGQFVNI